MVEALIAPPAPNGRRIAWVEKERGDAQPLENSLLGDQISRAADSGDHEEDNVAAKRQRGRSIIG